MCGAPPPRGAPATQSLPACVRGSCGGVTGVKVTWRHLCAERRRCCAPGSLGRGRRRQPARREAALSSPARSLGGRWREQKGKRKRPWFRSPAPRSSSPHSAPPSPVRHRESPQTCPTRAGIGVQPTANGERPSLVQAGAAPVEAVRCVLRPAPSAGPQVRAELPAPSSGPDFGVYPSPTRLPGFRCPASEFKDTAPEEGRTQNALICHPVRAPQSCPKRPVPRGDRPLRDPTPRSFQSGGEGPLVRICAAATSGHVSHMEISSPSCTCFLGSQDPAAPLSGAAGPCLGPHLNHLSREPQPTALLVGS